MISILLVAALVSPAQASPPRFEEPGVFRVETPPGSDWQKLATRAAAAGGEASTLYFWQKRTDPDPRAGILVADRVAATDEERIAEIRRHRQALRDATAGYALKDVELDDPEVGAPVPDRVSFGATGRDAAGRRWTIRYTLVFGRKNVYRLEALAPSKARADSLMETLQTFQEL